MLKGSAGVGRKEVIAPKDAKEHISELSRVSFATADFLINYAICKTVLHCFAKSFRIIQTVSYHFRVFTFSNIFCVSALYFDIFARVELPLIRSRRVQIWFLRRLSMNSQVRLSTVDVEFFLACLTLLMLTLRYTSAALQCRCFFVYSRCLSCAAFLALERASLCRTRRADGFEIICYSEETIRYPCWSLLSADFL